jgi:hypothetical protein
MPEDARNFHADELAPNGERVQVIRVADYEDSPHTPSTIRSATPPMSVNVSRRYPLVPGESGRARRPRDDPSPGNLIL